MWNNALIDEEILNCWHGHEYLVSIEYCAEIQVSDGREMKSSPKLE